MRRGAGLSTPAVRHRGHGERRTRGIIISYCCKRSQGCSKVSVYVYMVSYCRKRVKVAVRFPCVCCVCLCVGCLLCVKTRSNRYSRDLLILMSVYTADLTHPIDRVSSSEVIRLDLFCALIIVVPLLSLVFGCLLYVFCVLSYCCV